VENGRGRGRPISLIPKREFKVRVLPAAVLNSKKPFRIFEREGAVVNICDGAGTLFNCHALPEVTDVVREQTKKIWKLMREK